MGELKRRKRSKYAPCFTPYPAKWWIDYSDFEKAMRLLYDYWHLCLVREGKHLPNRPAPLRSALPQEDPPDMKAWIMAKELEWEVTGRKKSVYVATAEGCAK